jgi:hypothetical protein
MEAPAKLQQVMISLQEFVEDVADTLVAIDRSTRPFRSFQPGVGPYGEPQLMKLVAVQLNTVATYRGSVRTRRTPDLLIPGEWAFEFKITRPFGDNGKEAENWSVNLLHPYAGNVSTIGDCYKLIQWNGSERLAVVVIGYEHTPPKISLNPLVAAFEAVCRISLGIPLSERIETRRTGLVHPVHQSVRVFAWELGRDWRAENSDETALSRVKLPAGL